MNKEKRRVPKLRFPGFTEDWEQRKLSQITARVTRKNGSQSDLPLTISAQDGLVDQRKYFNRQVASRDMSNYYLIKKGEFAYNKSYSEGYPFGAVKRLDYYDIGALSTLYILFEITDKNISSDFIASYYKTHLWYKEISKRAAEGARNHGLLNISTDDFFDSELNIPNSIEEQIKIGNFIKQFDKFITLHQRKLEHLNLKKKALLQKLFPKNGERYPELRFPGFTDAWEQRKFLDLLDAQNGIRRGPFGSSLKKDSFVKKSDYVVYEQQNAIYDNYETRYFISKEKYNELIRFNIQPGDFIMSGAGTIGRISMVPDGIKKGVFNQALIRFKVNKDSINPLYFLKFMQSDMMQKLLTQANPGSAMTNLVPMDELKKWDVTIPSLEEQNRISTFINQIDEFITLHQRKLEHLQLQKKALLQQMFV